MSLLSRLSDQKTWEAFLEYKQSLVGNTAFSEELSAFVREKRYLAPAGKIQAGEPFPLPKRAVISKLGSQKKRTVYIYPEPENTVLKLLTWLILRKYDGLFSENLYSFRPGRNAKDAVRHLIRIRNLHTLYSYKADIHDYFNSIPVDRFLPMLRDVLSDDPALCTFLTGLLTETQVLEKGQPVLDSHKGIMAGTPLSAFYANLYLRDLDRHFSEQGVLYVRYSDDMILFGESETVCRERAAEIRASLAGYGLTMNPDKECFSSPDQGFIFLGFSIVGKRVDIAPATLKKLKGKMRRKRDGLARWHKRNGVEPRKAAAAFIRIFNRKLLESPEGNDLSWSSWFFSVINTTESLHLIDQYAQDCIRYLLSGSHRKSRFEVRYEDLKALGYRSLVHEYYKE